MLFLVEGNIGAGKSSLITATVAAFEDTSYSVAGVLEPVSSWSCVGPDDVNVLQAYYSDPKRYSFLFQTNALITRVKALNEAISSQSQVIIAERSIFTDKYLFVDMLHDDGIMNDVEYNVYCDWWEFWKNRLINETISGMIYVSTDSITCYNRIKKRARTGEELVSLEYIEKLQHQHDVYFAKDISLWKSVPHLTIGQDSQESVEEMAGRVKDFIAGLLEKAANHAENVSNV